MTPKRYGLRWYNSDTCEMEDQAGGEYVQYTDYERIKARSDRLIGLILKVLDVWWPFVHGTHASNAARDLRQELSDAIQPDADPLEGFLDKLATACAECEVPDSTYEALCVAIREKSC